MVDHILGRLSGDRTLELSRTAVGDQAATLFIDECGPEIRVSSLLGVVLAYRREDRDLLVRGLREVADTIAKIPTLAEVEAELLPKPHDFRSPAGGHTHLLLCTAPGCVATWRGEGRQPVGCPQLPAHGDGSSSS